MCTDNNTCSPCAAKAAEVAAVARRHGITTKSGRPFVQDDALVLCNMMAAAGLDITGSVCDGWRTFTAETKARLRKQVEGTHAERLLGALDADVVEASGKSLTTYLKSRGLRHDGPVTDLGVYLKADTHDPVGTLARDWIAGHVRIAIVGGKSLSYADSLEARAIESGQMSFSDAIDMARPLAAKALGNLRGKAAVQADQDVDALARSVGITLIERAPQFTPEEIQRYEDRLATAEARARMGKASRVEAERIKGEGPQHDVAPAAPTAAEREAARRRVQANLGLGPRR
jgi:hypothetical protein